MDENYLGDEEEYGLQPLTELQTENENENPESKLATIIPLNNVKAIPKTPVLKNYLSEEIPARVVRGKTKDGYEVFHPQDAKSILQNLNKILPGWPKVCGDILFGLNPKSSNILWIKSASQLVALLAHYDIMVDFKEKIDGVLKKTEFFAFLQQAQKRYDYVQAYPHFAPLPDVYYHHKEIPPATGQHLNMLISYFLPATAQDQFLLRAAFMTVFWGGEPGTRPSFVFTGPENDPLGGRGVGKTFLIDTISALCGGYIAFDSKVDLDTLTKRILSSHTQRILRFDNIKTNRLSSADIEQIITGSHISGHKMYSGHESKPNYYTAFFSLNDVAFSTDMAQRSIQIKLERPRYKIDWQSEVGAFIKEHKWQIIADIGAELNKEPTKIADERTLRFAPWQREVLSKATPDPNSLSIHIASAQTEMDDEQEQAEDIRSAIFERLSKYRNPHKIDKQARPDKDCFLIKRTLLAEWVNEALGDSKRWSNKGIFTLLRRLPIKELWEKEHTTSGVRCFIWNPTSEHLPGGWLVTSNDFFNGIAGFTFH